jgi:hypothetical protein
MNVILSAPLYAGIIFCGIIFCIEIGRRLRRRNDNRTGLPEHLPGLSAIEGAVFGLFGLMIAFSFYGAASRFDLRRSLITEEANTIWTAYLRIDLLAPSAQPPLRDLFRAYLNSRLETYRNRPNVPAYEAEMARSKAIQGQIWKQVTTAVRNPDSADSGKLLLPAVNEMFAIATTRSMAARSHPPTVIFYLLIFLGWAAALFAGYGMADKRQKSWLHILGFAAFTAIVLFVIVDLEFPRYGFIRLDSYDQVLVDVRNSMN